MHAGTHAARKVAGLLNTVTGLPAAQSGTTEHFHVHIPHSFSDFTLLCVFARFSEIKEFDPLQPPGVAFMGRRCAPAIRPPLRCVASVVRVVGPRMEAWMVPATVRTMLACKKGPLCARRYFCELLTR